MCAKGGNYTEKQLSPLTIYVSVWLNLTGLLHPCDSKPCPVQGFLMLQYFYLFQV